MYICVDVCIFISISIYRTGGSQLCPMASVGSPECFCTLGIHSKAVWGGFLGVCLRMTLFESVVALVALYACSTWTLTKQQEMALRPVQRRMLRKMFARSWFQPDSTGQAWPDYIREATAEAVSVFAPHSGKSWVQAYRARK